MILGLKKQTLLIVSITVLQRTILSKKIFIFY